MTNGNLMKVERIAECSPWSILQYFDLYYTIFGLETNCVVFLKVAVLPGFTVFPGHTHLSKTKVSHSV